MDPEDLREVISAYQKCVSETVQRFGEFVEYMGDGVLVYFGYPQAHEAMPKGLFARALNWWRRSATSSRLLHCRRASVLPPAWLWSAI